VVTTAPLDPGSLHGSELRPLVAELRRAIVRAERADDLVEASSPVELLAEIAERGEVARDRLFLIAGQGAALIVAFAAFAAAMRRSGVPNPRSPAASSAMASALRHLQDPVPSVREKRPDVWPEVGTIIADAAGG
jgi:hypothetical protein